MLAAGALWAKKFPPLRHHDLLVPRPAIIALAFVYRHETDLSCVRVTQIEIKEVSRTLLPSAPLGEGCFAKRNEADRTGHGAVSSHANEVSMDAAIGRDFHFDGESQIRRA
ncbi:MAG TPA: hypothetical protein VKR82_09060 [Candidatus Acidoferrales bacterium]|nr:hypothetical protein [Candidatus Acidoferrales bacterium]